MKYIIGNWKMNLATRESLALVRGVLRALQGKEVVPSVVLCPSFTSLTEVHKLLTRTRVELGAQNAGPDRAGAMTGEVGLAQLEDVGCKYAIIGHSERRAQFHEDDALIRARLTAVLASSLTPILCVGEPADARARNEAVSYVTEQLHAALRDQAMPRGKKLVVAYEPIWAIGSGHPATPQDAVAMHRAIRDVVKQYARLDGDRVAVVYGGSVEGANAYQFLREAEIDGVLVGGASLRLNEFESILQAATEVIEAQG